MEKFSSKSLNISPRKLRNICIMAHVDHGKTTLADALIATNGIITQRQAGKIRYLDSRKDEVERGITMKSSCVTLTYKNNVDIYVINLIDSPGHVDFSSEVSTAVRLCDGTIIVVDVVEGVCAQTKVVLRQAWMENIRPVLLLNKIDRLILEMKLTPLEAFYHISKVIEQVNAFMGELYNTDVFGRIAEEEELKQKLSNTRRRQSSSRGSRFSESESIESLKRAQEEPEWSSSFVDDTDLYFSPEKGNVTFSSAFDGWGFRLCSFAKKYHKKFDIDEDTLTKGLWGDFFIASKSGRKEVVSNARDRGKPPLFVSLILNNIFKLYEVIMVNKDTSETERMSKSLNITVPMSVMRSNDCRLKLNYIMSQWLPLADSVLEMVVTHLPRANEITDERAKKLMCTATQRFEALPLETQKLKESFIRCSSEEGAPLIVYVSKVFGVDKSLVNCRSHRSETSGVSGEAAGVVSLEELEARRLRICNREKTTDGLTDDCQSNIVEETENGSELSDGEELIAFARIFSGTLHVGQKVLVLGPKHDPNVIDALKQDMDGFSDDAVRHLSHVHLSEVKNIYLLMGRQLEPIKSATAGSIIGIGGLEGIHKSATVSSTPFCPPFTELTPAATPILRVAVEPTNPTDLNRVRKGLGILDKSDPCVQVSFEENGEYVIVTAGEVHLQRCIRDLEERYAKVSISVSPPIVPFRETLIPPPTVDRRNEAISSQNAFTGSSNERDGVYEVVNSSGKLRVQALPLPSSVTTLLEEHSHLLSMLSRLTDEEVNHYRSNSLSTTSDNDDLHSHFSHEAMDAFENFKDKLQRAFESSGNFWMGAVEQVWSFGPNYSGCNILLNRIQSYSRPSLWQCDSDHTFSSHPLAPFDTNFITGFQMATSAGPLCEEPMMGVCFVVEAWEIEKELDGGSVSSATMGLVISNTKDALRKAFEGGHQRLVCAMYSCVVSVTSEVIGRFYNLIGKRHGRVVDGDMTDGSTSWNVTAYLPVVESFDFANDLRKCTSGEAMPQLFFSHWEILNIDPFWEPQTTEEVTHWGEKADSENLSRKYINVVRRRKGLPTEEKIVESAEKQRNLSKNK